MAGGNFWSIIASYVVNFLAGKKIELDGDSMNGKIHH